MSPNARRDATKPARHRFLWFIALWLLGVAGTALLVLPFHLMIAAAMRH
ncbi:hypothetical protein [Paraburkholderia bryophila]|uniref:DUF2474 family protein n=1 Tax=Paraburkholderia bryophila TaxID=420952 RepID=A0A7Y9W4T7_9BURK|nr:hypothetical protein [Paraburkholderia bryophila]NYH14336.1 hypothetical protein [Paraburkholderia bryophila]NYH27342.1 hypothetical protein [Paraburkholderia bryophila]